MEAKLVAPCGINCNICRAYLRGKKSFHCCHSFVPGATRCVVINCEERKLSQSGYCYECKKFPCRRIRRIDERYRKVGISNIENLGIIKEKGVAYFIEKEEKKFKCPECGAVLSGIGVCFECGHGKRIFRGEKIPLEKITDVDLIAPCGMNCGVCGGYLALKYDLRSKGLMVSYCRGCIPRGRGCSLHKSGHCEKLMGMTIRFCFECEKFPCQSNKRMDEIYRTRYNMSMIDSLIFIKENGMEKFLEKEKEKWQCPECGGVISCHTGICFSCGVDKLRVLIENRRKSRD